MDFGVDVEVLEIRRACRYLHRHSRRLKSGAAGAVRFVQARLVNANHARDQHVSRWARDCLRFHGSRDFLGAGGFMVLWLKLRRTVSAMRGDFS